MRKNSFAIRVVKSWNSLPEEIVSAPTTNPFKNRLKNITIAIFIIYLKYNKTT
jgi:hypothetical protein